MKKKFIRGFAVLFNVITVILLGVLFFVWWHPRHESVKLKKNFNAAIQAAERLHNAAKTFYIERNQWPSSVYDLQDSIDAEPISAWEIANKIYSCELSYGRGDQLHNTIKCVPIGKYASVLYYEIPLSGNNLRQRYCNAIKTNQRANDVCKEIGGVFSYNRAGGMVWSVYTLQQR